MDANHQSVSYLLDRFQDPGMEEDPLMSISCLFYLKTALENSPKSVEKSCFGGKILSVLLQILRKDFHSSDRTKEVALYSLAMEILHLLSVLKYPAIDLLLSDTSLPAHLIRFLDMAGHFYRFTLAFSKELDQLCSHVSFSQQKVTVVPMTKKVLDNLVTYEPNIASCAALSHVYKCHLVFPQEETAVVVAERLVTKGLAWKQTTDITASQPPLLRCVGDLVHPLTKDTAIPQPSCVKESCLNDVFVLDIIGGHYFWGYIGRECVSRVDSISDLLQTELPALTVCQPGVGDLVVVSEIERCSERPQVMRGKVIKVTEEEVTVFAVDYGSFKTVKSCSLYQLSDRIQCLATVDAQAKLCCLAGVQAPPIDTATVEFALASLTNLVTHANSPGVKFLSMGGLGHICDLLHCGTPSIQLQCLRLLSNISSDVQLACTQDWTSFVRPLVEILLRLTREQLEQRKLDNTSRNAMVATLFCLTNFMHNKPAYHKIFFDLQGHLVVLNLLRVLRGTRSEAQVAAAFQMLKQVYPGLLRQTDLARYEQHKQAGLTTEGEKLTVEETKEADISDQCEEREVYSDDEITDLMQQMIAQDMLSTSTRRNKQDNNQDSSDHSSTEGSVSGAVKTTETCSTTDTPLDCPGNMDSGVFGSGGLVAVDGSTVRRKHNKFYELGTITPYKDDTIHHLLPAEKVNGIKEGYLAQLICSMLNSEGGTIFLGLTKQGRVSGVQLIRDNRDRVRLGVDTIMARTQPVIPFNQLQVDYVPVVRRVSCQETEAISDLFVVEITIQPPTELIFYILEGTCLQRIDITCRELTEQEVREVVVKKEEAKFLPLVNKLRQEILAAQGDASCS